MNGEAKANRPWIVGLTGGIGSGKSTAAEHFARQGVLVVDTDAISKRLTSPGGRAMQAIRMAFGPDVVRMDGALDRNAMRNRVFANADERAKLESILHPMIREESIRVCNTARSAYVVLVVPLLVESGSYRELCKRICVVDVPDEVQIERVRARTQMDEAEVRAIMAAQASRATRLALADDLIDNRGSMTGLYEQVERLHEKFMALASRAPAEG